jgi:DNA-binding Xre family transcriptional regulator
MRWRVRELLAERNMTLYEFAKRIGYNNVSSVYRRFPEDDEFEGSVSAKFLDRICRELGVGVGDVLEYVPDSTSTRHRKR